MKKAIYVHIPFCAKKCYYCDFTSYVARVDEIDNYLDSLEKEMDMYLSKDGRGLKENIYSIFIGGGTPSLLSEIQLDRLFSMIENRVDISKVEEYTIESNPGTLTRGKLRVMKEHGLNRLSIGLQAVQDRHLKFMGRIHNMDDFVKSFELARDEGFENINVDLIFAFEGQTFEDWKESIDTVSSMNPDHISAYSLIIEEGTKFYTMYEGGQLHDFDEDEYIRMYRYTVEALKSSGYGQYEISNYSRPSKECKHNILYWNCENYYGFGLGASGFLGATRYTNTKDMKEYLYKTGDGIKPVAFSEDITSVDEFNERIILGLRKNEGILMNDIEKYLDETDMKEFKDKLKKQSENGLLVLVGDSIKLSQTGREVSNSIFVDLMM